MRFIFSVRLLLFALVLLAISAVASAQVGIAVSINIAPPGLPVYEQPICPEDGYIWTPGYWAYGDDDYYWVPGTWVMAPEVGYLWTPGYWGWGDNAYFFHEGYWGTQVGFYGGISYGYGYFGNGYEGGRWDNGQFFYNKSVSNVNVTVIHNVYNTTVVNNTTTNRVSFNGGNGGVTARPTSQQEAFANEKHIAPVAAQTEHAQAARANPELRVSVNHGKPPIAATAKPGAFKESGAVAAKEGGVVHSAPAASAINTARSSTESPRPNAATARPATEAARPSPAVHVKDLPPAEQLPAGNTGNSKQDQKYQQQQQKLQSQQVKERQTLQTKQEQDHQRLPQTPANQPKQQPLEQQHQQQTQQLAQKHTQQQQQLLQRQQAAPHQVAPKPPEKEKPAA
jgi:DNA segregation ATPase FtsK/SpoIIIE-like protein